MASVVLALLLTTYVALTVHDLLHQRLPNKSVTFATILGIAYVGLTNEWVILMPALVWPCLYYLMWRVGNGLGGGDVKLALSTGILAAHGGMLGVLIAIAGANLLSIVAIKSRQLLASSSSTFLAHGPFMVVSALAVFFLM